MLESEGLELAHGHVRASSLVHGHENWLIAWQTRPHTWSYDCVYGLPCQRAGLVWICCTPFCLVKPALTGMSGTLDEQKPLCQEAIHHLAMAAALPMLP